MRKKYYIPYLVFLFLVCLCTSCKGKQEQTSTEDEAETVLRGPIFNEDSAMTYCAKQCEFGPRTMNSEAHEKCCEWIADKFRSLGCDVTLQKADLKGWDGTTLKSTNIIATFGNVDVNKTSSQEGQKGLLLCAHWDSRPWADNDPDETKHKEPVMAANDAASGVGVMLELARIFSEKRDSLPYPITFVCLDAEDYGTDNDENSWALGAQYLAKHLPQTFKEGILLDMVGGQGSKFYQEGVSLHYAPNLVSDVWQTAQDAGYGSYFPMEQGGFITDDHKPLNEAGIPTIDIIPYYPDCEQSAFGPTWHTTQDDMQHMDKNVLKAVGQTISEYIVR